ncbi:inner membrane-spanning protein YciB [Pseudoalteromonas ruthenica]|uniref:inner membrane-spanning protein YciB n=1 Tax=Pseudoalteromonas ruthenica TaxID=151081 RepID=UPI00241F6324|nr:inner membrane-spanning protein YciB [Pseudoalteromonas ruthenica]|tara:strand:- start:59829 stop:60410 length:582 start_codon:yes stop_codon:yes gene_type:complete
MSTLIEYIPLILFFAVYKLVDIYWATGVLIGTSGLQLAYGYFKEGHIAKRHWVFFTIALVLGTMTILFRDEHFIQWKATFIYALLALVLLAARLFFKKNLVQKALTGLLKSVEEKQGGEQGQEITVPERIWEQLNIFWVILFAVIAVLNIYVAYNFSLDFWVNFKVFGLIGITFVAIIATIMRLYPYFPEEES